MQTPPSQHAGHEDAWYRCYFFSGEIHSNLTKPVLELRITYQNRRLPPIHAAGEVVELGNRLTKRKFFQLIYTP